MLSKVKHKTRLTQNKSKTHKLCKNKNTKREKKVIESLGTLFLPHLGRTFPLIKLLNRQWGGKNWNCSSSKGTWRLWEDLQGEKERIEADSGFRMLSCRCSVEWLTTYSNLVEYDWQFHNDDRDATSSI